MIQKIRPAGVKFFMNRPFEQTLSLRKCFPNRLSERAAQPRGLLCSNTAFVPACRPLEIKKLADRELQGFSDLQQASCADAANAAFVFVDLLRGDTDLLGQRVLGQPAIEAVCPNPLRDQLIDQVSKIRLVPDAQAPLLLREFVVHNT
jgi:hypothetical protein